jgi:hypothetical protein
MKIQLSKNVLSGTLIYVNNGMRREQQIEHGGFHSLQDRGRGKEEEKEKVLRP